MQLTKNRVSSPVTLGFCAAALSTGAAIGQGRYYTDPSEVVELNAAGANTRSPCLSEDELAIVFASDRPGGKGGYDLFLAQRASVDAPFGPPVHLSNLSSQYDDMHPHLSFDGRELYFTVKQGATAAIHVATRPAAGQPFGSPSRLPAPVNGLAISNGFMFLTKDGLTMHFTRENGAGLHDILTVQRPNRGAPWGALAPFGPAGAVPGDKLAVITDANGERVLFACRNAAGNVRWYGTHVAGAAFIAPYPIDELDGTAGWMRGATGRFFESRIVNGLHIIAVRCLRFETQTIEFCVDVDLVPVWDPLLQIYIYQQVWTWEIGTVTTLETYTWRSLPFVGWVLSAVPMPFPLHLPGIQGAPLLIDPAFSVFSAITPSAASGLSSLTVGLPNNPNLVGQRVFAQAVHFDPATLTASLSEPIEMRITQ
jgi:hypothetical protein